MSTPGDWRSWNRSSSRLRQPELDYRTDPECGVGPCLYSPKRLRDRHPICERYAQSGDAATAKWALAVATHNAYPADREINRNGADIKSQDHETRSVSAAIVCDGYFLQSPVAVGEVDAGQSAPTAYGEPEFRAGPIEKRCSDAIFYPVIRFDDQHPTLWLIFGCSNELNVLLARPVPEALPVILVRIVACGDFSKQPVSRLSTHESHVIVELGVSRALPGYSDRLSTGPSVH